MLRVKVTKNNIERALKTLKDKFIKTKVPKECRDRKEHIKKSVEKREVLNKAKYLQKKYNSEN